DLTSAAIWLASYPNLATQSPAPVGTASLNMSPLTTQARTDLGRGLRLSIADGELQKKLLDGLSPILRDDPEKWKDQAYWESDVEQAKKANKPSDENVPFLAHLACDDDEGYIAKAMAERATNFFSDAKPLAKALLDEKCKGSKVLADEMPAR